MRYGKNWKGCKCGSPERSGIVGIEPQSKNLMSYVCKWFVRGVMTRGGGVGCEGIEVAELEIS